MEESSSVRISRLLYPVYHRKLSRGVFIKELFCKRIVSLHKIDIISFFKFPLSIESKWGSWFHSLERKFSIDPFQMQILIEDVLQRLIKRSCNTDRARFVSLVPSLITVFQRVFIGTNSSLFIFCERIITQNYCETTHFFKFLQGYRLVRLHRRWKLSRKVERSFHTEGILFWNVGARNRNLRSLATECWEYKRAHPLNLSISGRQYRVSLSDPMPRIIRPRF